jgi:hypothetical protein
VENQTGSYEAVGVVCGWPAVEPSYEDSARFAAALARSWHVEEYRFDRMARLRFGGGKTAVWRFCAGYELRVVRAGSRCEVEVGEVLELASDGRSVGGGRDNWAGVLAEIDRACDAFYRLAQVVSGGSGMSLEGPQAAVAANRDSAHRLAAMGAELEAVVDPGDELDATIDEVAAQLEGVRSTVIEAVRMISQVQLAMPGIFPSEAIVDGELDLRALVAGFDELEGRETAEPTAGPTPTAGPITS